MCRWMAQGLHIYFFTTSMDIAVSPKRKPYLSAHTLQMLSSSGSGDWHALTRFLYCWKQDDNVQQPCRKGAGNGFGPSRNPFYLYTLMSPVVLDHHNWWVEHPQSQRLRRELWNRRCLGSTQLDHVDDRTKPDLLWEEEEEEVGHHLPLQNAWEE